LDDKWHLSVIQDKRHLSLLTDIGGHTGGFSGFGAIEPLFEIISDAMPGPEVHLEQQGPVAETVSGGTSYTSP
jgi:hypothetical protein